MRMRLLFLVLLLLSLCAAAQADILISEIGPSNRCAYIEANGDTPDWVELYNDGAEDISLEGWRLSDKADGSKALTLNGLTIPAGGCTLIPLPGSAGISLSASGETVYLFEGDALRQSVAFPALDQDVSYALLDGGYAPTWLPTPGTENLRLGEDECYQPQPGPRISEALTSAAPFKASEGHDFLELWNSGSKTVNMAGWRICLGMGGSKSYTIPKLSMEKNQYYGIYCAEYDARSTVTGFKLPAQGTLISLWRADGTLADFIRLPHQYANISYGLSRDGSALGYLPAASYGRRNAEQVYGGRAETPAFSLEGGVYREDSVTVSISCPPGAEIRYTTNGDTPTAKSMLYTGPLTLTKTTALRAAAFMPGLLRSEDIAATYVLGLDADFPVISLIIDRDYLYDQQNGLISGKTGDTPNYKLDWEYPVNFEYMDDAGSLLISQRCGFAVQGDSTRGQKQKGFKLVARKSYGTSDTFDFNPFDDRSFTSYKSFNLRAAGSEGTVNPRFRDASMSTLAEGTELLYSAAQPALVYLNGEIYGHYNLRERINKYFIAQHTGITDPDLIDRIDLLSEMGNWVRSGSNADYYALSRFMKTNDLNVPENLQYVLDRMNVQSYFEYISFMMCTGNRDLSNSRFYRVPGGKWSWVVYDMDRGMEQVDNIAAFWLYTLDINHELELLTDHVPFAALMRVPAMREQFFTTLGNILYTRFNTARLLEVIDAWHDRLLPLMPYQLKRWAPSETMHYWESLVNDMRRCARQRPGLVVEYAQRYFHLSDEEVQRYFGNFLSLQAQ